MPEASLELSIFRRRPHMFVVRFFLMTPETQHAEIVRRVVVLNAIHVVNVEKTPLVSLLESKTAFFTAITTLIYEIRRDQFEIVRVVVHGRTPRYRHGRARKLSRLARR